MEGGSPEGAGLVEEFLLERGFAAETERNYRRDLLSYLGFLEDMGLTVPEAGAEDVSSFAERCAASGMSAATVSKVRGVLLSFYRWLERAHGMEDVARAAALPPYEQPDPRPPLAVEHARAVIELARRRAVDEAGMRDYALVCLYLLAAMRPVEVHAADAGDVVFEGDGGFVAVAPHGRSAGTAAYMPKTCADAVGRYLARRAARGSDPLLASCSARSMGARLSKRSAREVLQALFRDAGVPGTPSDYSVRATAVGIAAESGANDAALVALARTRSLNGALRYAPPSLSRVSGGPLPQKLVEKGIMEPAAPAESSALTAAEVRAMLRGVPGRSRVVARISPDGALSFSSVP